METLTTSSAIFYSGAVGSRRRWMALDEAYPRVLRILYSDTTDVWHEVTTGVTWGYEGVAAAVVDDTTAIVAWPAGSFGVNIGWGLLRGARWETSPQILPELNTASPRFRRRGAHGQWLAWGTKDEHLGIASYAGGVWSTPETLRCAYDDPLSQHGAMDPDLSRDDDQFEYPAVVWATNNNGYSPTTYESICVCIPSDSGFTTAEELAFAANAGLPTVIRDRNGDVWVAWWMANYWGGVHWSHTYTTAVTDTPRVVGAGRLREVRWRLSEPAPGTWWAMERARGDEAFEKVARVHAAPGVEQAWTDTAPPAGLVRYRIRRESVDQRYEWLSAEARWPAKAVGPRILRLSANPVVERLQFEITDAPAGPLEVTLYDLQGRVVRRAVATSAGAGRDAFSFELAGGGSPLHAGVYFLRARDAAGRESATAKIAIVR